MTGPPPWREPRPEPENDRGEHARSMRRRWRSVTVACRCGWIMERCTSRGDAKRAHASHVRLLERSIR